MTLLPCARCRRHVDTGAQACPFCGAPLAPFPALRALPTGRLTRAAVFAFGAAALAATTPACGGGETKPEETVMVRDTAGGGGDQHQIVQTRPPDAGPQQHVVDHHVVMPYGAPPSRARSV